MTDLHLGVISIANELAFNIMKDPTKEVLINILKRYNTEILQSHFLHPQLKTVRYFLRNTGYVTYRSNGNPYYVVITDELAMTPNIFLVDKKIQGAYTLPRIGATFMMFKKELFRNGGTILEGEMVRPTKQEKWYFVFDDIISFMGEDYKNKPLKERLFRINDILENYMIPNDTDIFVPKIKAYYPANEEGITKLIDLTKNALDYTSRGLFLKGDKGKKILINFNDNLIKVPEKIVKEHVFHTTTIKHEDVPKVTTPIVPDFIDTGIIVLKIWKTETADVYKAVDPDGNDVQICVPNLACSRELRQKFETINKVKYLTFECGFKNKFGKFYPIREV